MSPDIEKDSFTINVDSEGPDQPGQPQSLISVFTVCLHEK